MSFYSVIISIILPGWSLRRTSFARLGNTSVWFFVASWLALVALGVAGLVDPIFIISALTLNWVLICLMAWLSISALAVLVCALAGVVSVARGTAAVSRRWLINALQIFIAALQILLLVWLFTSVNAQRELLNAVFVQPSTAGSKDGSSARPSSAPSSTLDTVDGRVNVLLLGGDAGVGRVGLRPDSISVLSVDVATGQSVIIGVPRNLEQAPFRAGSPLYGPYPNGYDCGRQCLISYLYTYGSGHPDLYSSSEYAGKDPGIEATKDAVEGVLGIRIPYVVLIDMAGFSQLVNAVGGIEVCVPVDTLAQDMKTNFAAGCQHMTGEQALLYSRTRYDSNDYGRMAKQRLVQQAIFEQISPLALATNYQSIAGAGSKYVTTNIPRDQLPGFLELAAKTKNQAIQKLELVPPVVDVTNPDFSWIQGEVQRLTNN